MRRFTDTQKWDDPWFHALPGAHKLVFLYVIDRCNNAGFLEIQMKIMSCHTGLAPNVVEGAIKGLSKGLIRADGWIWVRRFLRHQKNEPLNSKNPAHRQIIEQIRQQVDRFSKCSEFQHFLAPCMGLTRPIGIGIGIGSSSSLGEVQENPFLKPTLDEAVTYGVELGMAQGKVSDWHDYYETNGWLIGKHRIPMKDWKASLRISQRRNGASSANGSTEATKPKKFFYLCPPGDLKDEG